MVHNRAPTGKRFHIVITGEIVAAFTTMAGRQRGLIFHIGFIDLVVGKVIP